MSKVENWGKEKDNYSEGQVCHLKRRIRVTVSETTLRIQASQPLSFYHSFPVRPPPMSGPGTVLN